MVIKELGVPVNLSRFGVLVPGSRASLVLWSPHCDLACSRSEGGTLPLCCAAEPVI